MVAVWGRDGCVVLLENRENDKEEVVGNMKGKGIAGGDVLPRSDAEDADFEVLNP